MVEPKLCLVILLKLFVVACKVKDRWQVILIYLESLLVAVKSLLFFVLLVEDDTLVVPEVRVHICIHLFLCKVCSARYQVHSRLAGRY